MYLRRIATDADLKIELSDTFALVISGKNPNVVGKFDIDASLLAKAICEGLAAVVSALQNMPDALAEVAKLDLAVKSVMGSLTITQATPTSEDPSQYRRPML